MMMPLLWGPVAARGDAGDVEAAQSNALAGEPGIGGEHGAAIRDQGNVGARAAHVERDDPVDTRCRGDECRSDHAGSRAGQQRARRLASRSR